ncbi:MAG: lipopolysaccharide export system protein LptA [Porticoccaceae bacterium]|nr:MAG: lipopolysaccharide export system protein LptA [Porticoccaceae bacterium]
MAHRRALLLLALLAAAGRPAALPEDRQAPIQIEAREAIREEALERTVYTGDVVITQGSIRIEAERVEVHTRGRRVVAIVCTGSPASYRQIPEPGAAPVVARARTIRYDLEAQRIVLEGDALLEQDGATLSGARITYDLRERVIRARGGEESGRERIRMVIPPERQPEVE